MKQILLCASALLMLASCSKKETTDPTNDSLLRNGKWKITNYTIRYDTAGMEKVIDMMVGRDTCRTDDYITFDSSYTGMQQTGKLSCGSELTTVPFEWAWKDNQKTIVFNNAHYTLGYSKLSDFNGITHVEAKVVKLTSKNLTISYEYDVQYLKASPRTDPPTLDTIYTRRYLFTQMFANTQ